MDSDKLEFRKLGRRHINLLVEWARVEGWDPGVHDADIFSMTFPDSFYGYFLKDEFIGGGSLVSYDGEFGFMGFFIVKAEYRGGGIGKSLWYKRRDTLLQQLNPSASIGMDGVLAMQHFYSSGGFEIAFRDERRVRKGAAYPLSDCVTVLEKADFEKIQLYDKECFGFSRTIFLEKWLYDDAATSFKYRRGDDIVGYAVIRRTGNGLKIGPLFADDQLIAGDLYRACLNCAIDRNVYLDVPMKNAAAVELIRDFGTEYVFECARMYFGSEPGNKIAKTFGITTFELG
jgi:GNAT superfamily N-acetyltransferase